MHAPNHIFGTFAPVSVDRASSFPGLSTEPSSVDSDFLALANAYRPFGGIAASAEIAGRLPRIGIARLARGIVAREVVCLRWHGDYWLPRFQFHGVGLEIAADAAILIAELAPALDESELARWFVTPDASLQDRMPLQVMQARQASFAPVHDAARQLRFLHRN